MNSILDELPMTADGFPRIVQSTATRNADRLESSYVYKNIYGSVRKGSVLLYDENHIHGAKFYLSDYERELHFPISECYADAGNAEKQETHRKPPLKFTTLKFEIKVCVDFKTKDKVPDIRDAIRVAARKWTQHLPDLEFEVTDPGGNKKIVAAREFVAQDPRISGCEDRDLA